MPQLSQNVPRQRPTNHLELLPCSAQLRSPWLPCSPSLVLSPFPGTMLCRVPPRYAERLEESLKQKKGNEARLLGSVEDLDRKRQELRTSLRATWLKQVSGRAAPGSLCS